MVTRSATESPTVIRQLSWALLAWSTKYCEGLWPSKLLSVTSQSVTTTMKTLVCQLCFLSSNFIKKTKTKQLEQRQHDHMRFIKQGKLLYLPRERERESDRERKWVLYFNQLLLVYRQPGHTAGTPLAYIQVTQPQSRHPSYLYTNNPATEQAPLLLIYK